MVQGYTAQSSGGGCVRTSFPDRNRHGRRGSTGTERKNGSTHIGGPTHKQRPAPASGEFKLRTTETTRGETGGPMLSISELGRFYYLRGFHDMRCKYARVLSVIHQQMNREPQSGEVYIMMSKDLQTVRLYSYEKHSCSLYEKRFDKGYKFMKVSHDGDKAVFTISWDDVVVLLGSPVVKTLKIK